MTIIAINSRKYILAYNAVRGFADAPKMLSWMLCKCFLDCSVYQIKQGYNLNLWIINSNFFKVYQMTFRSGGSHLTLGVPTVNNLFSPQYIHPDFSVQKWVSNIARIKILCVPRHTRYTRLRRPWFLISIDESNF